MTSRRTLLRRVKLRYVLFAVLLLSGIIPFTISSFFLFGRDQEMLENKEREYLIAKAGTLSREIDAYLGDVHRHLDQLGHGLLLPPGPADVEARLHEPWVVSYLGNFRRDNPDLRILRVLDARGSGLSPGGLSPRQLTAMDFAWHETQRSHQLAYHFVDQTDSGAPVVALAMPVSVQAVPAPAAAPAGAPAGAPSATPAAGASAAPAAVSQLVVEVLLRLRPLDEALTGELRRDVGLYLYDAKGGLLWSNGRPDLPHNVVSYIVSPKKAISMTHEYTATAGGKARDMVAQVSPVPESGWRVVVERPQAAAFGVADQMVWNWALATLLLAALALLFALVAARLVSQPIQRLAATSHEIADGDLSQRVEVGGLGSELADLADDFNRMTINLESHVRQLRQAAQANRELFIGSLRAFVAAVDAKDPYTRGHSERVAAVSRTVAQKLGLPEEVQHKVWIGALLHDVGKIGVEDRILRKSGVLTPEEYDQMKLHTVMGADILSRIQELKEVIPAVRWHHEAWAGGGYPDGLKGEQIPLLARIVAVADCFDAITTNRPYQQAGTLQFAIETITRLTGKKFDAKVVTAFLRACEAGEVRVGVVRAARSEEPAAARPPVAKAAAQ
jgi:putative nucleotidyltransferase with HDIG domain